MTEMTPDADRLSAHEVRRRAKQSVVIVGLRSVGLRLLQLVGLLVLGRLLTPADFGAVAIGLVFVGVITVASQAGIGATLIRRPEPPSRDDLATLLGFQLGVATALAAVVAGAALGFGREGRVTALMVASLPLVAVRAPGVVVLERRLDYRAIVYSDFADTLVYYGWAVATVAAGWGVWGLASAVVPRAVAGSTVILAATREALVRPAISPRILRGLLGFGVRLQAIDVVNLVRDQGLNVGVAAISGLSGLGAWTFAYRIMQMPYMLFTTLWRVSFPAMSRLVGAGEDMKPLIERGVALTAIATGAVLVPLTASAPVAIPAILGERWDHVPAVIPWASLGLMIGGPISVAVAGYLYAIGDARTPLRATIAHTAAWLAVALALLRPVGLAAIGLGWLVASLVDAVVLGRSAARAAGARVIPPLVLPTVLAVVAGGLGWAVASRRDGLPWALAVAAAAEALFIAGVAVACRGPATQLVRTLVGAVARNPEPT